MAYRDLSEFIAALEQAGELKRVSAPVEADLEVAAIADRVVKAGGPALLFENVAGREFPVLINAFGSEGRMCLALGTPSLDELGARLSALLEPPSPTGFLEKIKALPKLMELNDFLPRRVSSAPCQEVVERARPSLDIFPILRTWPGDAGPFITLPLVFTRDPGSGRRNVGMYRLQVYDERTTGMHWQIHKHGAEHYRRSEGAARRLPVAVALGGDPAVTYAATAPLPEDMDEMLFAGFIRRKPVEMVACVTVDLEVPAQAEIVLEGYVDPGERRREGPFGDHTGFYSPADDYPVFHLTCVTRRRRAVYPATVVGRPPMEDAWLGKATERVFLPLLQKMLPEIVDMDLPVAGAFHNVALISIRKRYPGHAHKIMHALWGMGQMMFTKAVAVFDAEVDVHDYTEVLWRLGANLDPGRDTVIVKGPVDSLEHASALPDLGTKMGFDATRKWPSEGYARRWPAEIRMSEEILEKVARRWKEYGIEND